MLHMSEFDQDKGWYLICSVTAVIAVSTPAIWGQNLGSG